MLSARPGIEFYQSSFGWDSSGDSQEASVGREGQVVDVRRYSCDCPFQLERWPLEDLYFGLIERFVERLRLTDPEAIAGLRGRSAIYLANHQVAVESPLFSILAGALGGLRVVTIAKLEHQQSWLGRLIARGNEFPGVRDPELITYFDRSDPSHNNVGKLQLVLLAEHLENTGFAFWNLGHPSLQYKQDLGARVIPRGPFLERWFSESGIGWSL